MLLVHRGYSDKLSITPHDVHWVFDQCVFFTACEIEDLDPDNPEHVGIVADASYSQGDGDHPYALPIEDISHIDVSALVADAAAEKEIRSIFGADCDAEGLLDGSVDENDEEFEDIEDAGWHLQRIRAQTARRMGFHAVVDHDEQGKVYIIDFADRNVEMNACWRYLGLTSELYSD